MKTCSKCGQQKPHFHKNKTTTDGLSSYCSDCANQISHEWQQANAQRSHDIKKGYFERHKEEVLARKRKPVSEAQVEQRSAAGKVSTPTKAATSAENGRKGGRKVKSVCTCGQEPHRYNCPKYFSREAREARKQLPPIPRP